MSAVLPPGEDADLHRDWQLIEMTYADIDRLRAALRRLRGGCLKRAARTAGLLRPSRRELLAAEDIRFLTEQAEQMRAAYAARLMRLGR